MIRYLEGCLLILNNQINSDVLEVSKLLSDNGAKVYLVGGAIRDILLGLSPKDFDLEVYNISFEKLKTLLKGYSPIINDKFRTLKFDSIEIALPRKEHKVGLSYMDYELDFENIDISDAVMRRDLTINAIMYDIINDEIIDLCDGIKDLNNKIIKAIDYNVFIEDPTRLLRMLEFKFRLDFTIDEKTYKLKDKMDYKILEQPKDVVLGYFEKIICSQNFDVELFLDCFSNLFESEKYKSYISNSLYHPEKSLYNHLIGVIKCLRLLELDRSEYIILFWALFFHDYGKFIDKKNHEFYSVIEFNKFSKFIVRKEKHRKLIIKLIEDHMIVREYAQCDDQEKMKKLKLKYRNQFYLLEKIGMCDYGGRLTTFDNDGYLKRMNWFRENILVKYKELR